MPDKRCFPLAVRVAAGLLLLLLPAWAEGPTFRADYTYQGSALSGWHTLGQADWKAQNGEIVGTPKAGGGWLILDKSFSNVGLYAEVLCTGGCQAGMLFRAEKTPDGGMKGIYVSLTENQLGAFAIKLDAQGREVSREKLEAGNSDGGLASVNGNTPEEISKTLQNSKVVPLPAGVSLPGLDRPVGIFHSGAWNQVEVLLYGDALHPYLNGEHRARTASCSAASLPKTPASTARLRFTWVAAARQDSAACATRTCWPGRCPWSGFRRTLKCGV